ncbi:DEAD/DEAH box helicase [Gardnerella pickettii]|uniref:DEAD/DEAH box helicase n=1 Tax=Gardnerella TaxID=2701 RepID=UPI00200CE91A|nr:DEAD/DEAH box helicase [Gardnerella vaginalis]
MTTLPLSPSQRFSAFRKTLQHSKSMAAKFESSLSFDLDDFQLEAIDALENGDNVLVAAPTGAGKTVVADFAVFLGVNRGVKTFYTTPIKALSNQKYHDFCEVYGSNKVGLLTGDTSVNSEADIVVMTTEVLRNMLYERSITLNSLGFVVLDEVHYLADKFRGAVWEEVIIHLPQSVKIIGLSATVSNVEDFSAWISSVRGNTHLIVDEHRPVPLERHVIIQKDGQTEPELLNLYDTDKNGNPTNRVNLALTRKLSQWENAALRKKSSYLSKDKRLSRVRFSRRKSRERSSDLQKNSKSSLTVRHTPKRWAVIDELDYLNMLPGIYFIFSRSGCDQAVQQCLNAGLALTSDEEMYEIRRIVDSMISQNKLSKSDLKALRFERFRYALEQGFAAHHAGMIAIFRHIVETLFERGLIKIIFATETLALGLNMPARSVVVEKLVKYDGTGHVPLTPGEFTQLTGRAGRRGIDDIGHAVLIDNPDFDPAKAASLSSKRVYPLHSSFVPTFNMAVNLLNNSDAKTARVTLSSSFAQWEANASAARLLSRIEELQEAISGYEQAFHCSNGDFAEFMTLRMRLKDAQHDQRRKLKHTLFSSDLERSNAFKELDNKIASLRIQERNHPCANCPDIQNHLHWGYYWARETKELNQVKERYNSRTGSVARCFDNICNVLCSLDYLKQTGNTFVLTNKGQLLRRLYNELDVVFAQAICEGIFNDLTPIELLSCVSSLVYESRGPVGSEPRRYPGGLDGAVFNTVSRLKELFMRISNMCLNNHLDALKSLDFGAVDLIYDWAQGADLLDILQNTDITGGDFVRFAKRLIDLLNQLAVLSDYLRILPNVDDSLAHKAYEAVQIINRGVVAYCDV